MTNPDQHPWSPDPERVIGTRPNSGRLGGTGGERGSSVFDGNLLYRADGTLKSEAQKDQRFRPSGAGTRAKTTPTNVLTRSVATVAAAGTVTLTATLASPLDYPVAGLVTFKDGATTLGTGTLNTSEVATFAKTGWTVGAHSLTAEYPGSADFNPITSAAVTLTVTA